MKSNPSLIIRIDDRLVHGQVLVGWTTHFSLKQLIIANDAIAASEWETNMMLVNATRKLQIEVYSLTTAWEQTKDLSTYSPSGTSKPQQMLLLQSIDDLHQINRLGLTPGAVNLGGIHYQSGRSELLPFLFLSDKEKELLIDLQKIGFSFYCQDIPQKEVYQLSQLLKERTL